MFDLNGFDPKAEYGYHAEVTDESGVTHYYRQDGHEIRTMTNPNRHLGQMKRLIFNMALNGGTEEEFQKAIRHSMVVIDAQKDHLDWKKSQKDNDILKLWRKYVWREQEME